MHSTTGAGAAYTARAGDDFGRIQEVNNRCPPLLSPALVRTVLGIFARSQEVSDCCPPFFSPACVSLAELLLPLAFMALIDCC